MEGVSTASVPKGTLKFEPKVLNANAEVEALHSLSPSIKSEITRLAEDKRFIFSMDFITFQKPADDVSQVIDLNFKDQLAALKDYPMIWNFLSIVVKPKRDDRNQISVEERLHPSTTYSSPYVPSSCLISSYCSRCARSIDPSVLSKPKMQRLSTIYVSVADFIQHRVYNA
jgi:hypothetical protein